MPSGLSLGARTLDAMGSNWSSMAHGSHVRRRAIPEDTLKQLDEGKFGLYFIVK